MHSEYYRKFSGTCRRKAKCL